MTETILALHGVTMSGSSMLRSMGPFADRLRDAGYEIVAPDGGHRMNKSELEGIVRWVAPLYEKQGRDAKRLFRVGAFWDGNNNYDWFAAQTDQATGLKIYDALDKGLDKIAAAISGKTLAGIIGFSQGAALSTLLCSLIAQQDQRFSAPKFGLFLGGFAPRVLRPIEIKYPIAANFPRMLVVGERDALFSGGEAHLQTWDEAFETPSEHLLAPCGHEIPNDPKSVDQMMDFVHRSAP